MVIYHEVKNQLKQIQGEYGMLHGVNICRETLDESKMLAALGRCLFLSPKKEKQQDVLYSKDQPVSQVTGGTWWDWL